MKQKKKYLAIITMFQEIDSMKTTMGFVLKKLSEKFERIYYINAERNSIGTHYKIHNFNPCNLFVRLLVDRARP